MKPEELEKMTIQQACDYAVKQIVDQGGQCVIGDNCSYSNGKGQYCVIGWLLDESNSEMMEYLGSVSDLIDCFKDELPSFFDDHEVVLNYLQSFHDHSIGQNRHHQLFYLAMLGIDVTGGHWKKWAEMGD
jgi:hypothetical protein